MSSAPHSWNWIDGSLAIDSFGGAAGGIVGTGTAGDITTIDPTAQVDTDMTNDHPISITYRDDLDGELRAKTYNTWTYGNGTTPANGTADLLDTGDKVQCTSCHDVHATLAGTDSPNYLLKIDNSGTQGSDLCLACHAK